MSHAAIRSLPLENAGLLRQTPSTAFVKKRPSSKLR